MEIDLKVTTGVINKKITELKLVEGTNSNSVQLLSKLANSVELWQLEKVTRALQSTAKKAIGVLNSFLPTQKRVEKNLNDINSMYSKDIKLATQNQAKRESLEEAINIKNRELTVLKNDNQLTDRDLERPLVSFTALVMMLVLTAIEIFLSYSALQEYFDGLGTLLGVNGILGLFSSVLAMLAGQFLRIKLRINREVKKVNNAKVTSINTIPIWIKDHPSMKKEDNENKTHIFKSEFINFLIFIFMFGTIVITTIKFVEPLKDNNIMAYIIIAIVVAVNLIGFVSYEYLTYTGLSHGLRFKLDKKINFINNSKSALETLNKKASTPDVVRGRYNKLKSKLEDEYTKEYINVKRANKSLEKTKDGLNLLGITIDNFTQKVDLITNQDNSDHFEDLEDSVKLPEIPKVPNLFKNQIEY